MYDTKINNTQLNNEARNNDVNFYLSKHHKYDTKQ